MKQIERELVVGERVIAYDENTAKEAWAGEVIDCNWTEGHASIVRDDGLKGGGINESWRVMLSNDNYWELEDDSHEGYLIEEEEERKIENWKDIL